MNGLDYAVAALIAFGAISGLFQGALRMATSAASLVAGFYVASLHYGHAAAIVHAQFGTGPAVSAVLGYVAVFLAVFVAVQIAGLVATRFMRLIRLGWLDRLAGGAIGAAIAAVIAGVCLMLMTVAMPVNAEILRQSKFVPVVLEYNETLIALIPPEAMSIYRRNRDALLKYWLEKTLTKRPVSAGTAAPAASPALK